MKKVDVTGQRFNKLTAIKQVGFTKHNYAIWECKCDCGNIKNITIGHLKSGHSKSCGCSKKGINTKHSLCELNEYRIWADIKKRCTNKKHISYKNYGGKGVLMCERWFNDPKAFITDMGLRPSKNHSIDRINNNGNYEPSNCRWATSKEQSRNYSRNRLVLNLETGIYYNTIIEASESIGMKRNTLVNMLKNYNPNKTKFILL